MTDTPRDTTNPTAADIPSPERRSVIPPVAPRTNWNSWLVAGLMFLMLCACSGLCALLMIGTSFGKAMMSRAPVEAVLDQFMREMLARDADAAYELFSPRVQRQISVDEVQAMLGGNNYVLFDGYQSLSIVNLNISVAANTNQNEPQGTVASVDGEIFYTGGISGRFDAVLEEVDGQWMIHFVNVTVPPDKFDD